MKMQGKRRNPYYQGQAILSRRDHSAFEVKQKLRRQKFTPQEIEVAIARLREQGLLNDQRFARAYVESILRSKDVGPRWLKAKLVHKGVAPEIITVAINQIFTSGREEELARSAARNWQRSHPAKEPGPAAQQKQQQRLTRFLISRGFSQTAYSFLDSRMSSE